MCISMQPNERSSPLWPDIKYQVARSTWDILFFCCNYNVPAQTHSAILHLSITRARGGSSRQCLGSNSWQHSPWRMVRSSVLLSAFQWGRGHDAGKRGIPPCQPARGSREAIWLRTTVPDSDVNNGDCTTTGTIHGLTDMPGSVYPSSTTLTEMCSNTRSRISTAKWTGIHGSFKLLWKSPTNVANNTDKLCGSKKSELMVADWNSNLIFYLCPKFQIFLHS